MSYQIHPRGVEPVLLAGGKVIGSGHVSRERAGCSENVDNILAPAADPNTPAVPWNNRSSPLTHVNGRCCDRPTVGVRGAIAEAVLRITERRMPDFIIGGHDNPYLMRWYLVPRNRFVGGCA